MSDNEKQSIQDGTTVATIDTDVASIELGTDAEKRLVRKLDWTLIPLFTLICELHHILTLIRGLINSKSLP